MSGALVRCRVSLLLCRLVVSLSFSLAVSLPLHVAVRVLILSVASRFSSVALCYFSGHVPFLYLCMIASCCLSLAYSCATCAVHVALCCLCCSCSAVVVRVALVGSGGSDISRWTNWRLSAQVDKQPQFAVPISPKLQRPADPYHMKGMPSN